jgi:hypothetical protein
MPRPARAPDRLIRAPLSSDWFTAAAGLGGKALAVGLALHYYAGSRSVWQNIPVSNELMETFNVSRNAKRYALKQLANAGLITMTQEGKAAPRVTIVGKRGRAPAPDRTPVHGVGR